MVEFEKDLMAHPTDVVLVVGDVTSTMACSIVAKKLNTKVCHVEAGIRSWDLYNIQTTSPWFATWEVLMEKKE